MYERCETCEDEVDSTGYCDFCGYGPPRLPLPSPIKKTPPTPEVKETLKKEDIQVGDLVVLNDGGGGVWDGARGPVVEISDFIFFSAGETVPISRKNDTHVRERAGFCAGQFGRPPLEPGMWVRRRVPLGCDDKPKQLKGIRESITNVRTVWNVEGGSWISDKLVYPIATPKEKQMNLKIADIKVGDLLKHLSTNTDRAVQSINPERSRPLQMEGHDRWAPNEYVSRPALEAGMWVRMPGNRLVRWQLAEDSQGFYSDACVFSDGRHSANGAGARNRNETRWIPVSDASVEKLRLPATPEPELDLQDRLNKAEAARKTAITEKNYADAGWHRAKKAEANAIAARDHAEKITAAAVMAKDSSSNSEYRALKRAEKAAKELVLMKDQLRQANEKIHEKDTEDTMIPTSDNTADVLRYTIANDKDAYTKQKAIEALAKLEQPAPHELDNSLAMDIPEEIREAAKKAGIGFDDLTELVLTIKREDRAHQRAQVADAEEARSAIRSFQLSSEKMRNDVSAAQRQVNNTQNLAMQKLANQDEAGSRVDDVKKCKIEARVKIKNDHGVKVGRARWEAVESIAACVASAARWTVMAGAGSYIAYAITQIFTS